MLAGGGQAVDDLNAHGFYAPAHSLKQFHPKYAAQADLDRAIKEAGVDNWVVLLKQKNLGASLPTPHPPRS